ncbi:MAG: hypothetical protein RR642_16055 [Solibacillus sp.]
MEINDELQKQQGTLYEKLRSSYQYKDVDYSQMDHTLDDFYGNVQTSVKFAIRDEQGNLILSTKRIEGETPIMNNWSSSGDNTDVLGEWIYTTTVPTNTNPTTFEVLQMQAYIFDFNEADHNDENWQPFELNGQIYELESMESRHKTLHIKLSTKEKSENYRSGSWLLIAHGKMHFISKLDTYVKNDRTIYNIQFEGFEEVPNPITFVPMTVFMKEELVEPIVLELR